MISREAARLLLRHADRAVVYRLAGVALMVVATSVLAGLTPLIFKMIVDAAMPDGAAGVTARPAFDLLVLGAVYVGVHWSVRMLVEVRALVHAAAHQRVQRSVSRGLFAHVLRLPLRFHLERSAGATGQTLANGLQGLQLIIEQLVFAVLPVVVELATVALVLVHLQQPGLLALFSVAMLAYAVVFWRVVASLGGPARAVSSAHIEAHGVLTDSLLNCEAIKSFCAEDPIGERYDSALGRTERHWMQFFRRKASGGVAIATTFAITLGATLAYAIQGVRAGTLTVGELVMISAYVLQVARPIEGLGYALQQLSQGAAFLEHMIGILRMPEEATVSSVSIRPRRGGGHLRFENVSLNYAGGQRVLHNVSLHVPPGATLAIVGASGAGKSSLVRLLTRLLEPDRGRILLDGVPLSSLSLRELRRSIAVVPQDTVLFNDSLRYNIAIGNPGATASEIELAAQAAQLGPLISTLPAGYETIVGERGVKLSGGERQRICIARVALLKPRVYVFDEATSSLDSHTESQIASTLKALSRGTTTLVIAHRLSTVVHADQIAVLHEGSVVELGTHEELSRAGGRYASLWKAQHGTTSACSTASARTSP